MEKRIFSEVFNFFQSPPEKFTEIVSPALFFQNYLSCFRFVPVPICTVGVCLYVKQTNTHTRKVSMWNIFP